MVEHLKIGYQFEYVFIQKKNHNNNIDITLSVRKKIPSLEQWLKTK